VAAKNAVKDAALKANNAEIQHMMSNKHNFQTDDITLNVGGAKLQTTLTLLRKDETSVLATMFSGRFPIELDGDGSVFLDRDLDIFELLIQSLEQGKKVKPKDPVTATRLAREFEFFQIYSIK
jgi:hypothetical protein